MLALLLATALAFTPKDAQFAFETTRAFVAACTPRDGGTVRGRIASNWLLDAASAVGADVQRDTFEEMTPVGRRTFTNLYAPFRSNPTSRWVVVVSHYDTKPGVDCPGANDGASTSALLVALANRLSGPRRPNGNVLLVWTDGEECMREYGPDDGFQGSKRAAAQIARWKIPVQAVICIDMLGDRELNVSIPANGTPALARIAVHAARRAGYPDLVRQIPECVKDDHVAFLERGYRAIDLIDFDYGPDNSWWHTPADTPDKLSEESFLKTGKLLTELIGILL